MFYRKSIKWLTKMDYIRKTLIIQDRETGKMTYEYRVPKNVSMTILLLLLFQNILKYLKLNLYMNLIIMMEMDFIKNSLIKVSSFILFFIFTTFIIISKMNLKKNRKFSNKYFEISD